jgi:hypothetical protein
VENSVNFGAAPDVLTRREICFFSFCYVAFISLIDVPEEERQRVALLDRGKLAFWLP